MEALDPESLIKWMNTLPYPRPFVWQRYIYWRRATYGLVSLLMLVFCVGIPLARGLFNDHDFDAQSKVLTYQIGLVFGALIVSAFARVSVLAGRLFDDCKWLARFGAVGEANLLWVLGNDKNAVITYRFWDLQGRERQREAVVAAENNLTLPALAAGDVIPLLFDPHKPEQRNMLWLEVSRYVRLAEHVTAVDASAASTGA